MNTLIIFLVAAFAGCACADRVENTHLVTMRKGELMKIVNCVSESRDPVICEELMECNNLMPKQVKVAYENCQKECVVGGPPKCSHEPLYASRDIPSKIFDCIVLNTHKLNPEENMKMVMFEQCSRKLFEDNCKKVRYFHH